VRAVKAQPLQLRRRALLPPPLAAPAAPAAHPADSCALPPARAPHARTPARRNRFVRLDSGDTPATAVAFACRSRRQLFVGFKDGSVASYDVDASAHVATLKGHAGAVLCLSARATFEQLLSSSTDSLLLWETKARRAAAAA